MPTLPLHPERNGEAFERIFRGGVGAAIAIGQQPEDRRALDDPALAAGPHQRDQPARQLVPTEEIRLELAAEDTSVVRSSIAPGWP